MFPGRCVRAHTRWCLVLTASVVAHKCVSPPRLKIAKLFSGGIILVMIGRCRARYDEKDASWTPHTDHHAAATCLCRAPHGGRCASDQRRLKLKTTAHPCIMTPMAQHSLVPCTGPQRKAYSHEMSSLPDRPAYNRAPRYRNRLLLPMSRRLVGSRRTR
jgi:hypothetical protein